MDDDNKATAASTKQNSINTLLTVTIDTLDQVKLQGDTDNLDKIENEFPHDMVVDVGDAERLSGLALRGISICDYWVPVLTVLIAELEIISAQARAKAFIDAEAPKNGKLTADVRKQIAEADPQYTKCRQNVARYEAIQERLKLKSRTFEKVHYSMKDQQKAYNSPIAGRHISGEEPVYKRSHPPIDTKKSGEEKW
jgi:hypothetical protein